MKLTRHGDLNLTTRRYTDEADFACDDAVSRLPVITSVWELTQKGPQRSDISGQNVSQAGETKKKITPQATVNECVSGTMMDLVASGRLVHAAGFETAEIETQGADNQSEIEMRGRRRQVREYLLRPKTTTHPNKENRKPDNAGSRESATGTGGCGYSRMWVFTSGARCSIEAVADRIKEVNRHISKLNAKPFMKAAGISIVFCASELGSLQRVDGKPTPARSRWRGRRANTS